MKTFTIATALVAALSAAPAVMAGLPATCNLNQFYADQTGGSRSTCVWHVCTGNNQFRPVRDCGIGARCKEDQPTTCIDKSGTPF